MHYLVIVILAYHICTMPPVLEAHVIQHYDQAARGQSQPMLKYVMIGDVWIIGEDAEQHAFVLLMVIEEVTFGHGEAIIRRMHGLY